MPGKTKTPTATAPRDPATGAPPAPGAEDSPPAERNDGTPPEPAAPSEGDTVPAAAAPSHAGPITPDGDVVGPYEPVGETGAVNAHGDVAGGMHEASVAADELATTDDDTIRSRAFKDAGAGGVTATRTVLMEFVPNGAKRSSMMQVFIKGQTYSRSTVAHRIGLYRKRQDAKVLYQD